MEISEKDLKALLKEHQATGKLLQAALKNHQEMGDKLKAMLKAPESERGKRRNLKQVRVDDYAADVAAGTWSKPAELRKTKRKQ